MNNGINPVAQTYYEISNIKSKIATEYIDYTTPIFTLLRNAMTDKGMKHIHLTEFSEVLNAYQKPKDKINSSCILKGKYKNGYKGENCTTSAPYLFFDIDVSNTNKKKENVHLLNPINNDKIFEALKEIAVIVWRSNSGNGIAGILYVPQIAEYTNNEKDLHKTVGESITSYLSDYLHNVTGVERVQFDPAQSKFRQVRFIAPQNTPRKLNPHPHVFTYKVEEKSKQTVNGVSKYRDRDFKQPTGSIYTQFDDNTPILDVMLKHGFTIVSDNGNKVRVKHSLSESSTTGEVDKALNLYFNYSQTFGGNTSYTPARIVCYFEFNGDWKRFNEHLQLIGYKHKQVTENELKATARSLKDELLNTDSANIDKIIFKHCFSLQYATNEVKHKFIKDNCTRPEYKKYFIEYLKLVDYTIRYDERFFIENYVSEVLPEILDYADRHNKVIVRAETGKGKTTAFVKDFHKHRPDARLLILVPLTIIVDQNRKDNPFKGVFLTGQSTMDDHAQVKNSNLVFATYEQATKYLESEHHSFDYIIIDEIHQLLTANSFKRDVIAALTPLLDKCKVIGLTGTPSQIFTQVGYKLLDVDVAEPTKTPIEVRYTNTKAFNIALNHLSQSHTGKVLIRLNEIETIKALITHLVELKLYKKSEILFLYSTIQIKNSNDYKNLAHERQFFGRYKLVFTTSLIDEGLSIDQAGFTDVVFIETNYNPRPEPVKQFFARFRNDDPKRKNYLYLRKKNNQTPTRFNIAEAYNDTLQLLKSESEILLTDPHEVTDPTEVLTTYKNLFSSNSYYYGDATINHYYLAYAVTQVLFMYMNIAQFLEYLESNYNLSFTVNSKYEVQKFNSNESNSKKETKQHIAMLWTQYNEQILQVLRLHSQDPKLRNGINATQTVIEPEVLTFAVDNIKHFETLFKRHNELTMLKVKNPAEHLIKHDGDNLTLQSNDYYRKVVLYHRIENTINDPQTKADRKTAIQFVTFAQWCVLKSTFTNAQMNRQLKKLGVLNYTAFNEAMLFELLRGFNLKVKKNTKTKIISCKENR